jgi:maleate isomerase
LSQRVGVLVPSSNTVLEVDLYRRLPVDYTVHAARMRLISTTPEAEAQMLDRYTLPAAADLASARPEVVLFGCTSAGALRGREYDQWLCDRIGEICGCPVVSVIAAVGERLRSVGAVQVGVITPYVEALNARIASSLEGEGLEVAATCGLGITENFEIAAVSPEEIVTFAIRALSDVEFDILFVSCTNFRGIEAAPQLEQAFQRPVVTSNSAALEGLVTVLEGRSTHRVTD